MSVQPETMILPHDFIGLIKGLDEWLSCSNSCNLKNRDHYLAEIVKKQNKSETRYFK